MLVKGADLFVDGSASLAKCFRVSSFIIGLTIVAFGTSAPELAVSITAAMQGSNALALSNVVGSNIFNLLCVLGVCAIFCPVPGGSDVLKRDFPLSILAAVLALLFSLSAPLLSSLSASLHGRGIGNISMVQEAGIISRMNGLIPLLLYFGYIVYLIHDAKKNPVPETEEELKPVPVCAALILVGLALVVGGGQAVVFSAKAIARALGMSETLIGLTVVALGTSLPELVTSVVAARKHETGLAVGNVIGSNIFNLMVILSTSAILHPVSVSFASLCDIMILIAVNLVTYFFLVTNRQINRLEGLTMISMYAAHMAFAIVR